MSDGRLDLAAWYAHVGAGPKERNVLRQDLVRGLKDYFESAHGYDRYGAETIFQLRERLADPYIYGFALARVLHDRRVPDSVKTSAARWAITCARHGTDNGLPFGLLNAVLFLKLAGKLTATELRYALLLSAGEFRPFTGMRRDVSVRFMQSLTTDDELSDVERLFWGHSLIARHGDQPGAGTLVEVLLGCVSLDRDLRREVCASWLNFRQPRISPPIPAPDGSEFSVFVHEHMPFWSAHMPSWPGRHMLRAAPVWLVRLGDDPVATARACMAYRRTDADQVHVGLADMLMENQTRVPADDMLSLIDEGLCLQDGITTRRAFYRVAVAKFGAPYLERAAVDPAGSVRQWAARQSRP